VPTHPLPVSVQPKPIVQRSVQLQFGPWQEDVVEHPSTVVHSVTEYWEHGFAVPPHAAFSERKSHPGTLP
jgi:hypothetical protein